MGRPNPATMNAGEGSSSSTPSDGDSRSLSTNDQTSENAVIEKVATAPPLQRRLKSRHLQMIAIGGTVGTGLVRKPPTTSSDEYPCASYIRRDHLERPCMIDF